MRAVAESNRGPAYPPNALPQSKPPHAAPAALPFVSLCRPELEAMTSATHGTAYA